MKASYTLCLVVQILHFIPCLMSTVEPNVNATTGSNVLLMFKFSSSGGAKIIQAEWSLEGRMVYLANTTSVDLKTQDEQFKGRVKVFQTEMTNGNMSLVLEKVTKADSGKYECKVSTYRDPVKTETIHLNVFNGGNLLGVNAMVVAVALRFSLLYS
ncbi:V-set domain-containing T-cell activation inhibitor 1-like isoform X2 [Polypterus senegalus]|uniref:V-set domain-containing T-cell activation inhibitor 1-like isoform X2 n=1 Tax=Polypterus senegalus TaxID=55291 RepID=UPI00196606F6|nr:V-set domain-containing T-cell activation inhibitor 1-like isoform X2 [Polypterus senegalus]